LTPRKADENHLFPDVLVPHGRSIIPLVVEIMGISWGFPGDFLGTVAHVLCQLLLRQG
jgi:hypothetical protein